MMVTTNVKRRESIIEIMIIASLMKGNRQQTSIGLKVTGTHLMIIIQLLPSKLRQQKLKKMYSYLN
jgi:hypothetical protein